MSPLTLLKEMLFTRWWARLLLLGCSCSSAIFGLLSPLFQKEFVDLITTSKASVHTWFPIIAEVLPPHPLVFLVLSFCCLFLSLGLAQLVNYLGNIEAISIQRIWAERLYNLNLQLRADSLNGRAIGEIVSVYTTDIPGATILLEQSLPQGTGIVFPLVIAPFVLVNFFSMTWTSILTLVSFIFLINFTLAYRQSRFFDRFKTLAADRIGLVNEWIQNIRTLRILSWISSFEERIFQVRKVETSNRIAMLVNGQSMNAISSSLTFFLNLGAIGSFLFIYKQDITPGSLFALLWIVGFFLTRPFRMLPWFFTFVLDGWTSLKRVNAVLNMRNIDPQPRLLEFQTLKKGEADLKVGQLNLSIDGEKILQSISFQVYPGEFIAIVGEVGSGKTMLLLSLLGETGASFVNYSLGDNDAKIIPLDQLRQFFTFVPQEGFIMSSSLRENVAFEYEMSQDKDPEIEKALLRSQFNWRTERLSDGLSTDIGERGVNLSGGQKQRVSLARVDYHASPIILLDDCLSAVDVDTENKLVEQLLKGAWKNRTRLMVTHRLTVLEKVDRIFFMEKGEIKAMGTMAHLLENYPPFQEYVATIQRSP